MEVIWITDVKIFKDYILYLTFNDGVVKSFDVSTLLSGDNPLYLPLKDVSLFSNIKLDGWTVTWNNGEIDIAPEFLYENGVTIAGI